MVGGSFRSVSRASSPGLRFSLSLWEDGFNDQRSLNIYPNGPRAILSLLADHVISMGRTLLGMILLPITQPNSFSRSDRASIITSQKYGGNADHPLEHGFEQPAELVPVVVDPPPVHVAEQEEMSSWTLLP